MPQKEVDYSKTVIYKLVCNDLNITDCYVGHTTDFIKRKYSHKYYSLNENKKDSNIAIYKVIRSHGGWSNWSMIEIEKYACTDGNEARKRERFWFEELNAKLNTQTPSRTREQYVTDNKPKIQEYKRLHHQVNKDKIIARVKKYNEDNHEHRQEYLKSYSEDNKERIKQYQKAYREKHKEQTNQYREVNKEKLKLQRREKAAAKKLQQQSVQ